jgi:hypothetical protein
MTYAAYLRIYEPVAAFHEPERSRWAAYAASPARRDSLAVEQAEALQRVIAAPQIVVPDRESEHAYLRRADGVTYICPWQTRLRCLLSYGSYAPDRGLGAAGRARARGCHVQARPRAVACVRGIRDGELSTGPARRTVPWHYFRKPARCDYKCR